MQPHWQQTRKQIEARPAVLLVQDTTEVDLTQHPKTTGVGQIGDGRGRGLYLQTVLALVPETGEVLGCAMQEPFVRTPAPAGETRSKRRQRTERETDVWMRLVPREGALSYRNDHCPYRRSGSRYVSVLSGMSDDADLFSGASI